MNKKILALLLAVLLLLTLAACGEKNTEEESSEVSTEQSQVTEEKDWRDEGKFEKAEAVVGSRIEAFLMSISDDRAVIYYDEAEQKVYGTAIYPEKLSDKEFTRYQTELRDLNNDGNADLCVPYLEADGETVGRWYYLWDSGIEDFVYDSEFAPEVSETEESSKDEESSDETSDESSEESSEPEKKKVTLYLDKSYVQGGATEVIPLEIEYEGEFGPGDAVNAIAEETWLNFSLIYQPNGEDIYIYWNEGSALHNTPTSLNPKYGLTDDAGLRWFMLDSLHTTFTEMGYKNVYFMGENGSDLILTRTDDVTVISGTVPYSGSGSSDGKSTGITSSSAAQLILERTFSGINGISMAFTTESSVEGEHCYIFIVTDSSEGAMTAETYFAVSDSGKVYAYDLDSGVYMPYSF